jgi:hypothetical protein
MSLDRRVPQDLSRYTEGLEAFPSRLDIPGRPLALPANLALEDEGLVPIAATLAEHLWRIG